MHMLRTMRINAKRDEVLARLRTNMEAHAKIVAEARVGYVQKAREALSAKLDALASGRVVALSFALQVPIDQTKVYQVAIEMLEMHQDDTIELDSDQVRNLMRDEWDWTEHFLATNSAYSSTAASRLGD